MFEIIVEKEGLEIFGMEGSSGCSGSSRTQSTGMYAVYHAGICSRNQNTWQKGLDFDRRLYVARRVFEQSNDNTYVVSLSSRTIVYKGMFLVGQLRTVLRVICRMQIMNLRSRSYTPVSVPTQIRAGREHIRTALSYTTVRSTRSVEMPTRCLHAKRRWSPSISKGELHKVLPVVNTDGSDSAMLDNTLEFLVMSGMDLPLAVMIMIPEPWANNKTMTPEAKKIFISIMQR